MLAPRPRRGGNFERGGTGLRDRRWNDANVLALGLRLTSIEVAKEIVTAFLTAETDPGEAAAVARVEPLSGAAPRRR
jgi:ribose 5-phosphate isomerase RpiB